MNFSVQFLIHHKCNPSMLRGRPPAYWCVVVCHQQTAETRDMKALDNLRTVGRVRYQNSRTFAKALETLVRNGDHTLLSPALSLDRFAANYFTKTGNPKCTVTCSRFFFLWTLVNKGEIRNSNTLGCGNDRTFNWFISGCCRSVRLLQDAGDIVHHHP